jgi:hypothetical protein
MRSFFAVFTAESAERSIHALFQAKPPEKPHGYCAIYAKKLQSKTVTWHRRSMEVLCKSDVQIRPKLNNTHTTPNNQATALNQAGWLLSKNPMLGKLHPLLIANNRYTPNAKLIHQFLGGYK